MTNENRVNTLDTLDSLIQKLAGLKAVSFDALDEDGFQFVLATLYQAHHDALEIRSELSPIYINPTDKEAGCYMCGKITLPHDTDCDFSKAPYTEAA